MKYQLVMWTFIILWIVTTYLLIKRIEQVKKLKNEINRKQIQRK